MGESTHIQLHLITPNSFNTIKIIVRTDISVKLIFTRFCKVGTKTFSIVASRTWVFGLIFDKRVEAVRVNFVDHSDESDHVRMIGMGK